MINTDEFYMKKALELAKIGFEKGEVPVGAIVVRNSDGFIAGTGFNRRETDRDASAHAEMIAIQNACKTLGGWRLSGCTLYVTLEPCPMCCGGIINSRIDRVVFGAYDLKAGSVCSITKLFENNYNHHPEFTAEILKNECEDVLKLFFKNIRNNKKERIIKMIKVNSNEQIKKVAELAKEIWHQHYDTLLGYAQVEYMTDKYQSFDSIKKQIMEDGYTYYIISKNGQHIGYTGFCCKDNSMFLSKLYIKKEYRGLGYGKKTLDYLQSYCKENKLNRIWLTVNKHNDNSIAVYNKLGFKTFKSEKTDIGNDYYMDDYFMELLF